MKQSLFIFTLALFCCISGNAQKIFLPAEIEMKDNVPAHVRYSPDIDKQGRGVSAQEYFEAYNSYIGVDFKCPQGMELCNPVSDYANPSGIKATTMMCIRSADKEFELHISMPMMKTGYNLSDFWKKSCESKLYYDPAERTRHIAVAGNPEVDRNIMHHLYIVGDGASDVVTRPDEYARDMFNADTVKIYDAPARKMDWIKERNKVDDKFTRCKVMTIQKHDRGYYFAYCLFTDKAYKKAGKYIDGVKGMIRYADDFVPSWKSYADIEDFASGMHEETVERAKWGYAVDIAVPKGYKPYLHTAGHRKRILLNLNPAESFGSCVTLISDDGNEMLVYSVVEKNIVDYGNFNMINLMFKELPKSFIDGMDVSRPLDTDFSTTAADGFALCSGTTQKLYRFVFLEDCDNGDMKLTPLSDIYPYMQAWQKYDGGKRLRIYRFLKHKPSDERMPKEPVVL